MMSQSVTEGTFRRYALQPGDGTLYQFFLVDLDEPCRTCVTNGSGDTYRDDWVPTVAGVASGGYMTVGICMPGIQGVYEVPKDSGEDIIPAHWVDYVASHMGLEGKRYTVAAVLLAAAVLITDPGDLEGACQEMLRAREIL
jgi:hypothetical protein